MQQSYATGTVSGADFVGGLVGNNYWGTVQQSYATGAVTGVHYVGGLVGFSSGGGATVNQSYATGAVSGGSYVGGLFGAKFGTVASSYWDVQTSGTSVGSGIGDTSGVTGLTTAQMMDSASFAGFDFASVWASAGNGFRPQLYGVSGVVGVRASATMAYGDAVPTLGASNYLGLGYWNTLTSGATLTTTANSKSNVGSYGITGSGAAATFSGAARAVSSICPER